MTTQHRFSAVVLAGSRGEADPVASGCRVSHKAVAPIGGRPMIEHVLSSLADWRGLHDVVVVIERPDLIEGMATVKRLEREGRLRIIAAEKSPSASVLAALDYVDRYPVLLTTADHPLLTPAMIDEFVAGIGEGVDVAALVAREGTIVRGYPDTSRTYLRFSDASVSGCNLFAVMTPTGRGAVRFWRRIERDRKRPWRMALGLGVPALIRFATRTLGLADAAKALGRRAGVRGAIVESSFADAAIDVDKMSDLRLVEKIVASRRAVESRTSN